MKNDKPSTHDDEIEWRTILRQTITDDVRSIQSDSK